MKQALSILVIAIALTSLTLGQGAQKVERELTAKQTANTEEQEILKLEETFRLAKLQNDVRSLDAILESGFIETNQNGNTRDKGEFKELFTSFMIGTLTIDKADVLVKANTAIVRGLQTENGDRMRFTRVYVKQQGLWKLLACEQNRVSGG